LSARSITRSSRATTSRRG